MERRTEAKMGWNYSLCLWLSCLLLSIPSPAVSDVFVNDLAAPTGLAIHPNERFFYIKSGNSGTVWKVPILLPAPHLPGLPLLPQPGQAGRCSSEGVSSLPGLISPQPCSRAPVRRKEVPEMWRSPCPWSQVL